MNVKSTFKHTHVELILFLVVNLTVLKSDAADGSAASASASLVAPVIVEHTIRFVPGSIILSDDTAGRIGIRLVGVGTFVTGATPSINAPGVAQSGVENSSKPGTEKGMLSGDIVTNVTMSAGSEKGPVSVIVSYD